MSHYYNGEWERRKSYLIRSLFCDIPYRGLSPVPEEGTLTSSEEYQVSSESSGFIPSEELSSDTEPSVKAQTSALLSSTVDNRAPSPLPPLIIEKETNKHDEPKEYYEELLIKIRRIYRKMFLENKDLTDDDLCSDKELNIVTSETNDNNNVRNNSSDGYNADYESITDDDNIDEGGNSAPNGDQEIANEDEINVSVDTNNRVDYNNEEMDEEAYSSNVEADYMQVTVQAIVHVDGVPPALIQPSPIYGESAVEINSHLNRTSPHVQVNPNTASHLNKSPNSISGDKPLESALVDKESVHLVRRESEEVQRGAPVCREYVKSPILGCSRYEQSLRGNGECQRQENRERHLTEVGNNAMSVDCEKYTEAPLQICTSVECSLVGEDDDKILEEEQDSETLSSSSIEEERRSTASDHVEAMRTLQPEASIESIGIENTRLNSDMDITSDHDITVMRDISNIASTSQNCQNIPPKVSFDLNILSSIVNENNRDDCQNSGDSGKVNKNPRSRKRGNEDIDIEVVNWYELRDNFFVGAPKIFKLCSCQSHICIESL